MLLPKPIIYILEVDEIVINGEYQVVKEMKEDMMR
jgi:hypothetical protein